MSGKTLVLVARKDAERRLGLYSALDRAGYLVATCSTGLDALKYVSQHHPGVVLCGTRLRDIGGLDLIQQIRSMSPATKVFLMSRDGDWAMYREVLASGGENLLIEPIDEDHLLKVLGGKQEAELNPL